MAFQANFSNCLIRLFAFALATYICSYSKAITLSCEDKLNKYFSKEDMKRNQDEYSIWRRTINDSSVVYRLFHDDHPFFVKRHRDHLLRPFALGPIGPKCSALDSFGTGDLEKKVYDSSAIHLICTRKYRLYVNKNAQNFIFSF
jgi:hypothetical protein